MKTEQKYQPPFALLRFRAFALLIAITLFASCHHRAMSDADRVVVAEVLGNFLHLDELEQIIPPNLHASDSADFAERYIRSWATNILMYEQARRNVFDMSEIDRLVNEYRKSLIIHHYQQRLLEQSQLRRPTEREIMDFYERYRNRMRMRENMIQGMFLVVPIEVSNLADVRLWMQRADEEAIINIDRFSLQNAASYDFFMDTWMPLAAITRNAPFEQSPADFRAGQLIETNDSTHRFFLRVNAFLAVGQEEPFELARDQIINILSARNNVEFISEVENQLFNRAVANGTVVIKK